ncbi:hypothetical protein [Catellatospora vulcania]|uniref:hypothetical protein n=1 Tax=Catellatospora vulcania TaxID=1460450 RepID=UPI0012D4167F|nr:hypothetical protein [Catellatospora vulcania]
MTTSKHLRARASTVVAFHDSLVEMLSHMERVEKWRSVVHEMQPMLGQEQVVAKLDNQTSRLAGRAMAAAGEYETVLELTLPHDIGPDDVPVIQRWRHTLDYPEALEPALLLGTLLQIAGRIEGEAELLERQERTLAGRVARFIGFPADVRAIAGQTSPGAGRAGFIVAIVAQVIGTLVLFGLGGWLGISLI